MTELTYPSGRKVKNTLDTADGDLSLVETQAAGGAWQTRANNFAYNAAGAVSSMQLGNGRWESTVFNSRMQPTQIALGTTQNATDLLKLEYGYGTTDNNGNVLSQKITVPGVTHPFEQAYTYDPLNRLKSAEEKSNNVTTWKQTFTFDRYGNRNFDTTNNKTTTLGSCSAAACNPTINAADNRFDTGQGYSYDLAGNTTADADGRTFVYDAENKQVSVSNSGGTLGTYHYDGDGRRIKKTASSGDNVIFVYDAAGQLIEEFSGTTLQTSYVYAGSRLLSTETSTGTSYLTNDHLGSPRVNTDQSGTVTARHDYHPFGEEIARTGYGSDAIRKQFTGYQRDGETGLDFAQARYYAKSLGRFYSVDPENAGASEIDPQSWNGYAYARDNPLLYVDPDGRKFRICYVGNECHTIDDKDFWAAKKNTGYVFKDGQIYDPNENENGESNIFVGTYERISFDDLDDRTNRILFGVGPEAQKKARTVRIMAAIAAGIGTCIGTSGFACAAAKEGVEAIIELELGVPLDLGTMRNRSTRVNPKSKGNKIYDRRGGMSQANTDFNNMKPSQVRDITTTYGPGKMGRLPSGETVILRPNSSGPNGAPTIEIQRNGRTTHEFRYR